MVKIKIKRLNPEIPLPSYETELSAGMDLRASIFTARKIYPGERVMIPTGIKIAIPKGYEAQIRPRSGLALRNGVVAILGTIDADYRGECGIILLNTSSKEFIINPLDRIAQMVVKKVEHIKWKEVSDEKDLGETKRGIGGFGHTGNK